MGTGSAGLPAGESLSCLSQASVFRIQEGHHGQLVNATNAPFMALIHLVVAATSQVYTLLHNTHLTSCRWCFASPREPLFSAVEYIRQSHEKTSYCFVFCEVALS